MTISPALIVAIDGPAGSGKSTVAKQVAARLGLPYIDTGAMYRAIAWLGLNQRMDLEDAEALSRLAEGAVMEFLPGERGQSLAVNDHLPGDELRTPQVSQAASRVSRFSGVRSALTHAQRRMGHEKGCVMEGRDVGTVVFPDAPVKVFLTASPEARAERRVKDWREKGIDMSLEDVAQEIEERDRRDAERDLAPMIPAPDAVVLATDGLTIDEVVDRILDLCRPKVAR